MTAEWTVTAYKRGFPRGHLDYRNNHKQEDLGEVVDKLAANGVSSITLERKKPGKA